MNLIDDHQITITGTGDRTILFSHGFGGDQSMFRYLVEAFAPDYRCVTYNLAGAGPAAPGRFRRERYRDLRGYAADVIAICEELQLQDVIHVGHSVSAMIGVLAANDRPDLFSSLVLIGPSARYINDGDYYGGFSAEDIEELLEVMGSNYLGWSARMGPAIMGNAERPALGEELAGSFQKTDPEIARFFARVTFTSDNRADLPKVSVPSLILQCDEDIIAPEAVGRYVHAHIPGSRFVLLKARGHCPNISEPAQTSAAIRTFLNELSTAAA